MAELETPNPAGDAQWIALWSPEVAEPLARWLEDAANVVTWAADEHDVSVSVRRSALAFAHLIVDAP